MKREIKARIKLKGFYTGEEIWHIFKIGDYLDYEEFTPLSDWEQYTGLKDKNGKEIYEGDVLDFGNGNPAKVGFDNGCFNVFGEPLGWDFDSEENPIKTDFLFCEIIGNLHENPELLKTK